MSLSPPFRARRTLLVSTEWSRKKKRKTASGILLSYAFSICFFVNWGSTCVLGRKSSVSFSPVCLFHQDQQVPHKSHSVVAKLFRPERLQDHAAREQVHHTGACVVFVQTKALEFLDVVRCGLFVQVSKTGLPPRKVPRTHRGPRCRTPSCWHTGGLCHARVDRRTNVRFSRRPALCVFGSRAPGKTHSRYVAQKKRNRQSKRVCSDGRPGCASSATIRSTDTVTPSCSLACSCSKGRRRRPPRRAQQTPPSRPLPCPPPPLRYAEVGEELVFCNLCSGTTLWAHPSSAVRKCKKR